MEDEKICEEEKLEIEIENDEMRNKLLNQNIFEVMCWSGKLKYAVTLCGHNVAINVCHRYYSSYRTRSRHAARSHARARSSVPFESVRLSGSSRLDVESVTGRARHAHHATGYASRLVGEYRAHRKTVRLKGI